MEIAVATLLPISVCLVALSAYAEGPIQQRPAPAPKQPVVPSANLRVDTSLVLVPVTVNDELNHPVTGLEKENFRIFDDKREQTITTFSTEDEPIALGLVFDVSGSMNGTLPQGRRAAAQFLGLADPEDEFFLVEFDTRPRLTVPLTNETGAINTEILLTKSGGSTALFDALYLAIHEMHKSKKTKKALVLISDGGENHSRYTQKELDHLVRESDVLIYTVLVPGSDADPVLMSRIAEMTGAHGYFARANDLPDIAQKILLRNFRIGYRIGFLNSSWIWGDLSNVSMGGHPARAPAANSSLPVNSRVDSGV